MALAGAANVVYSQTKGGRALVRFNGSGNVGVIASSLPTTNSDIAGGPNANADPILGAVISGVWFSVIANSTGGAVTVARGANTILTLVGTDHWTQADGWRSENEYSTANVAVVFSAGCTGCVFIEFTKQYSTGGGGETFQI